MQIRVTSVNIGRKTEIRKGLRTIGTGLIKKPQSEKIFIGIDGLTADVIVNQKHHGGRDQAVYLYSVEDYKWWERELGRVFNPGEFGENLTIENLDLSTLRIGDHLRIGTVELEISSVRIPCGTFAAFIKEKDFINKFRQTGKPGVYTRVITEGYVQAGDIVELIKTDNSNPQVLSIFFNWNNDMIESGLLTQILSAPVAERTREKFQKKIPV